MGRENLYIVDEDFNSVFSFKNGEFSIDYASMILLYGYLNGRSDWYYTIKRMEIKDFEYRSYVDFSRGLLNQLFELIKNYSLATDKNARISVVNNMKVICSQINMFCRSIIEGEVFGSGLEKITNTYLEDNNHMNVWNRVIRPLQDDALALKKSEEEYYHSIKQQVLSDKDEEAKNLPREIRNASSNIVDIVNEKEKNVREFYDRVNILHAFMVLETAIANGNYKEIEMAHKKILEQCAIVNECEVSPFRGDLRPMFTFDSIDAMIEHIKYGSVRIRTELMNIDMMARGAKTSKLASIKADALMYIESTLEISEKLGLLDQDFDLNSICSNNGANLNNDTVTGPSL